MTVTMPWRLLCFCLCACASEVSAPQASAPPALPTPPASRALLTDDARAEDEANLAMINGAGFPATPGEDPAPEEPPPDVAPLPRRAGGLHDPNDPVTAQEALPLQRCSADRDCTVVVNGCCPPGGGAPAIGVRKDKAQDLRKLFDCGMTLCPMSGFADLHKPVARCREHRCTYHGRL